MKEFRLPDPGEGLVEADIVRWVVSEGDEVKVNDILVEIETAKSIVELPSPWDGRIARLMVDEGATVEVGAPIVLIDDGVAAAPAPAAAAPGSGEPVVSAAAPAEPLADGRPENVDQPAAVAAEPAPVSEAFLVGYGAKSASLARRPRKTPGGIGKPIGPVAEQVHDSYAAAQPVSRPIDQTTTTGPITAEPSGDPLPRPGQAPKGAAASKRALAKPPVRRLARDLGLDLDLVDGTGPDGTITAEDVLAAAVSARGGSTLSGSRVAERVPLKGVRREMARTMAESFKVPTATVIMQADVTASMELVERLRARREFAGLRVSPLLIFAKAACLAIARNPDLNSTLDMAASEIVRNEDVNLGIAAATPRGLLVPNIKGANRMNLLQLAEALHNMVQVAKTGKVPTEDLTKGTFTITNVGVFGVDGGTPILNLGESAIMCLGTIARRPWVIGKGSEEQIVIRSVCTLSLTFDHRLVDGELASKFLSDVAAILADPGLAMMF
ncbi:dihydrolipoamide acetyltransferase family protein [Micropruina sp.]|uniref:dihydrolipoamide acetyltransferase family protein n=1 Tax=Micropruina sp. TaxID=2737536 RepID=UPI0039E5799B